MQTKSDNMENAACAVTSRIKERFAEMICNEINVECHDGTVFIHADGRVLQITSVMAHSLARTLQDAVFSILTKTERPNIISGEFPETLITHGGLYDDDFK